MHGAIVCMCILSSFVNNLPCFAKPLQDEHDEKTTIAFPSPTDSEDQSVIGAFEQDMILTPLQRKAIRTEIKLRKAGLGARTRTVISDGRFYWPQGIIPFGINAEPALKSRITSAIYAWENKTCIRFKPTSASLMTSLGHKDYVLINELHTGCVSNVGHLHNGQQFVNISRQCSTGRIIHELGHAIGFVHEQSRPDRDQFVHLNKNNIQYGKLEQFDIYSRKEVTSFGLPYDIGSIMHYSSTAFSIDGHSLTLTADDPYVQPWMGQRNDVSFLDAKLTNLAYSCNAHCSTDMVCNYDGYLGPSCTCVCPPGLSGPTCDTIVVTKAGCGGVLTATSGTLTSPNYPDHYDYNEECTWLIKAPASGTIQLTVEMFNLEDYARCGADFLEVKVHGFSTVGQKYCGHLASGFNIIDHKQGQDLLVRFVSDYAFNYPGFQIYYQTN